MRLTEFLEFAGVEIANSARTTSYSRSLTVPGLTMSADCVCSAIDEGYDTPATDPAPWYEPTRPESQEFFGIYAHTIQLQPVMTRQVAPTGRLGSYLGPPTLAGRQIQFTGTMIAQSAAGMSYGERWLAEALRGSPCADGGCPSDAACILPACPDDEYDPDSFFRTLVDVGCIDGPNYARLEAPECYIQEVSFNLVSAKPYLYAPATTILDAVPMTGDEYHAALTTPEWMGEGVFVIDITNTDSVATTDITITGRISLDGDCPVEGVGTSIPPSFVYTIPSLAPEDRIIIDGTRRQARYIDASDKVASSALPYITWEGAFPWPEVGSCTTMCVSVTNAGGDAVLTVQSALREL